MADIAPYLVELLPEHPFTRLLFTQSDHKAGSRLWGDQAASFIVSPLGLNALQAHLRLFAQIADQKTGRRLFFRFYAPEVLRTLVAGLPEDRLGEIGRGIRRFICHDGERGAFVLTRKQAVATALSE